MSHIITDRNDRGTVRILRNKIKLPIRMEACNSEMVWCEELAFLINWLESYDIVRAASASLFYNSLNPILRALLS